MSSLAQWCHHHRRSVVGLWAALFAVLVGAVVVFGSAFSTVADLPNSESATAYSLLAEAGMDGSSADRPTERGVIVWQATGAALSDPAVSAQVTALLAEITDVPGVLAITSPTDPAGVAQTNEATGTAYAALTVSPDIDVAAVRAVTDAFDSSTLKVAAGGQAFTELPSPSHGQEVVGIIAALAILLLVFRSVWASVLPILTGIVGVGTSLLAVMLGSHLVEVSDTALTMGALIGLGVGIDYALFIVNRYRTALMDGVGVPGAIVQAVDTSGRAVVFAGLTVMVALVGIFLVGLPVLTSMGVAAAVTVLFTVVAAITLLPALLSMLGTRVLSHRQRAQLAGVDRIAEANCGGAQPTIAGRWASATGRAPWPALVAALIVVGVLAAPVLSMRVGSSDASSDPKRSPTRQYADIMGPAFGEGVDATLLLVAQTPDEASTAAFADLVATLPDVPDIASVTAVPSQPGQQVSVAVVVPATSAQTAATGDLVHSLREDVIPSAESGTALQVYVGGTTATSIDLSDALMGRLPLYLGLVAVLGFLLLAMAFRSVLVPLVGALSNLATIVVGLGAITAIFQFGWGSNLIGVGDGAPIMYIIPVLIVGVMFGLSMDYQVFLVSRMREEWSLTHDNARAVRVGLTETGRVIATAAAIMTCVFASFSFSGERIVSAIGIGMAIAVLVDAFVVRMTLIPAVMRIMGPVTWAYPRWMDRITPQVSVEGTPTADPTEGQTIIAENADAEPQPVGTRA